MNNDDRNECLRQLSAELSQQIARAIIYMAITFFVIFLILQNVYAFYYFETLQSSEFSYLKSIGNGLMEKRRNEQRAIFNYIDSTNQALKYVSIICNQIYYLCNYSKTNDYGAFDKFIPYLKANSQLITTKSGDNITVVVNLSNFGISQELDLSLVSNIQSLTSSSNNYHIKQIQVNSSTFLMVICSKFTFSDSLFLCLTYFDQRLGTVGFNYYLIKSNTNTYNQTDLQEGMFMQRIQQYFRKQITSPIQDIQSCFIDHFTNYGRYIHYIQGLEVTCRHDSDYFLNFFGTSYLFRAFREQIERQNAIKTYQNIYQVPKITNYIIISPNSSYYQQFYSVRQRTLTNIRQTAYLILFTISCSIFLICISNYIIDEILLYSIDIITTICEYLKNKEEKEFNNQLAKGRPMILQFIIEFLKKFMWIFKLRKFKGKYIYKMLLLQGLTIFDEKDYIPVLKFIYSQLITLQTAFTQKLFKIKQLPHKKKQAGSKLQQQDKVIQPIAPHQQRLNKRRNANFNLLNPDDDELMKNISISFRGNRGVRFSNDIQTIEIDSGPILRKAKCSQIQMVSCQTIKNDLSQIDNDSIKRSDHNKDSLKSLKSQQQSFTSLIDVSRGKKKDSSKTRSLQSIHIDLDNLKLDQQMQDDQLLLDQQSEQEQIYGKTREQITIMISQTYKKVITYYQKLYNILHNEIQGKPQDELSQRANQLYVLTINKYEIYYELLLYLQSSNQSGEEIEVIEQFEDLREIERNYNHYLSNELIQQAEILKEGIYQAQNFPISLQNLQEIYCRSNMKKLRISGRTLLALAAEDYQPHLDLVLAKNIYANLKEQKTANTTKQQNLSIFMRNLERYPNLAQELSQLKMAAQFYNVKHKKFYFLASIASIKLFTPVLSKLYQLIDNFDIFNIFNLEQEILETSQNEIVIEPARKRRLTSDKIKYLTEVPEFIESFNFTSDKQKENQANSVKTISRKRFYQRQFHQILMSVEQDQVDYSKYIVIFLGDDHSLSSSQTEQSSSSANHRPYQQKIHLQMTKVIQKGYIHFILIGFHLQSYPSKYGRLKKYVKLSPQLFQVELSHKDQQDNFRRLQKYLR